MMNVSDDLLTVFSATVESRNGNSVVTVPERELTIGDLEEGEAYRVAILPQPGQEGSATNSASYTNQEASTETSQQPTSRSDGEPEPPVEEGETLDVEIEDVGDKGDGLARIDEGYIVFVPETDPGDRVTIEIEQAQPRFAFAELIEDGPLSG